MPSASATARSASSSCIGQVPRPTAGSVVPSLSSYVGMLLTVGPFPRLCRPPSLTDRVSCDQPDGWGMRAADGMGGTEEKQPTGSGRPTSRDVARLAGVSHTAVSFVFNGRADGNLSPATQERIRQAATQL